MKLDRYLSERSLSARALARQLDVSESYLSRLLSGERGPSLAMAHRIREATGGAVTADDFLPASEAAA
jgi:transcriptional regulator with XRE-family HTH domain